MASKIINMADRVKDKDDLALEALFRSEPVPDDGFTAGVMSRVRRAVWVRRLSMPAAIAIGLAISAKPLVQAATIVPGLLDSVFGSTFGIDRLPVDNLPQLSTVLIGATLLMAVLMGSRILED